MKKEKISISKMKFWFFVVFITFFFFLSISSGILNIKPTILDSFLQTSPYFSEIIFLGIMILAVAMNLPLTLVALAGFFVFEFYTFLIMVFLSILFGVLLMYFLARKLGAEGFAEYAGIKGTKMHKIHRLMKGHTTSLMIIFSFVYFFPSTVAGMTAAFTETRLSKFFFISFIANTMNLIPVLILARGIVMKDIFLIVVPLSVLLIITLVPLVFYRKKIWEITKILLGK